MKKIAVIKKLFLAYIFLIIIFNLFTLPFMSFIDLQLGVSIVWIGLLLILNELIETHRAVFWWAMIIVAGFSLVRPILEFLFSVTVPSVANKLFPPFTGFFAVIGFIIMLLAFIFLLDPAVRKICKDN